MSKAITGSSESSIGRSAVATGCGAAMGAAASGALVVAGFVSAPVTVPLAVATAGISLLASLFDWITVATNRPDGYQRRLFMSCPAAHQAAWTTNTRKPTCLYHPNPPSNTCVRIVIGKDPKWLLMCCCHWCVLIVAVKPSLNRCQPLHCCGIWWTSCCVDPKNMQMDGRRCNI